VVLPDGVRKLYQVCVSLSDLNTRKRELDAVCKAMEELSFDKSTIVTIGNDEIIKCKQGVIRCISLWKWLLSG
jgi:predicted AAA+ superfamily ATPase